MLPLRPTGCRPAAATPGPWHPRGPRPDTPFVAGDPHRLVELPGVYQQIRLACPEFDVVGLAFAGVPGTPHFAHAGEVAWGITNAMADCHDVFVEELRRSPEGVESREARRLGAGGSAPRGGAGPRRRGRSRWRSSRRRVGRSWSATSSPPPPVRADGPARRGQTPGCRVPGAAARPHRPQDVRERLAGLGRTGQRRPDRRPAGTVLEFTAGLVPQRHAANSRGPGAGLGPAARLDRLPRPHRGHRPRRGRAREPLPRGIPPPLGRDFASPDRATRIADLLAKAPVAGRRRPSRPSTPTPFHAPAHRILPLLAGLGGLSAGRHRRCATSCSAGTAAWMPTARWRTGMPCCGPASSTPSVAWTPSPALRTRIRPARPSTTPGCPLALRVVGAARVVPGPATCGLRRRRRTGVGARGGSGCPGHGVG